MLFIRKNGSTSNVFRVTLRHSTTGAGLTGLTEASSGLIIGTICDNESATTRYRAGSSEIETISTLGTFAAPTSGKCRFKEVDATNHPGLYEIQLADARFAVSSAKVLKVDIVGATNLLGKNVTIQLTSVDPDDAVKFGMTRVVANVDQFGGSAGTFASGRPEVNTTHWGGTAVAAANVLIDGAITAAKIASDAFTAAKFADGCLTAAKFASGAFDTVWSVATRLLTAGTNIVLAKGTGVTGFNDLSAAQVNAEADTALADYDGPTNAELATALAAADDSVLAAIAALNNLSSAQAQTAATAALEATVADSVPADGSRPSVASGIYMMLQLLTEGGISGTTWTIKKPDGTTTLFTITLNDATTPTSKTRSG